MTAVVGVLSALKTGRRKLASDEVAEGVELETNLLRASQRNLARSDVPGEVFSIHRLRLRWCACCGGSLMQAIPV